MQKNPDLNIEEAEDYLFDRQQVEMEDADKEETPANTLLNALQRPVE